MGNAFIAGLKNEAPRGRDVTNEDRNSEGSERGTQRDAEGSELSYTSNYALYALHMYYVKGDYKSYPQPCRTCSCNFIFTVSLFA